METTLSRNFFEKLIIALHELPDGILEAILRREKIRVVLEYDPQKDHISVFKESKVGQER